MTLRLHTSNGALSVFKWYQGQWLCYLDYDLKVIVSDFVATWDILVVFTNTSHLLNFALYKI